MIMALRWQGWLLVGLLSLSFARAETALRQAATPGRLNVLFILSDDHRADVLGAAGNCQLQTPHLDRLARSGVRFTQAHIMGGSQPAVCIPSRAMLLTGRSLFQLEKTGGRIPPEHVTLPQALRHAGWRTYHVGKWHQDLASLNRSFDDAAAIHHGGYLPGSDAGHFALPVRDFDPTGRYPKSAIRQARGKHSSELLTDAALDLLRRHPKEQPFFMYLAYPAPHDPRQAPAKFRQRFDPARLALPANFLPRHPFDNGELEIRDEKLLPWPRTPEAVRHELADYYAMIEHLDSQIGRLLDYLDAQQLAEHTLVVFTADNGLAIGSHGLLGKQNLYEHSTKAPLLIRGPGIPAGQQRGALLYLFDVFPTLVEWLGVSAPASATGKSFAGLLRPGSPDRHRDVLLTAYRQCQRAVRDARWKLIIYPAIQRAQLFDLEHDPDEITDQAAAPPYRAQRARLEELLRAIQRQFGDPLVEPKTKP